MKVILKQDVQSLGRNGSLVNVNDGYARNFLIPKGIAVEADNTAVNVMKNRQDAEAGRKGRETDHAKALAAKLDGAVLRIKAKAGESGKLFGSITSKDISDALKSAYNADIDRRKIVVDESIKSIGKYKVELKLFMDINAAVTLEIVKE